MPQTYFGGKTETQQQQDTTKLTYFYLCILPAPIELQWRQVRWRLPVEHCATQVMASLLIYECK